MNPSNNCNCVDQLTVETNRIVNGVFTALSSVASIVSIVITLHTNKYRECFKRLILYLSIVSLLSSVIGGLQMIDARSQWNNFCKAFGFLANYLAYSKSFVTFIICADVFIFARYHRQLLSPRREAVAIALATLIIPSILSSGYLEDDTWCATCGQSNCTPLIPIAKKALGIGLGSAPHVAVYAVSAVLVASVAGLGCRKVFCGEELSYIRRSSCVKLLSVFPLLLYPALLCLVYVSALGTAAGSGPNRTLYTEIMTFVMTSYYLSSVLLPLMLWYDKSELLSSMSDWAGGGGNNWRNDSVDSTSSARSTSYLCAERTDGPGASASTETNERSLLCQKSKTKPSVAV